MRKLTIIAALAVSIGVGLTATPIASAHFPATCDGDAVTLHFNGAAQAYVPLHIVGTTSVLVPFLVVRDGVVVLDRTAGLDRSAVQLTTCSFDRVDLQGIPFHLDITGILTPARP